MSHHPIHFSHANGIPSSTYRYLFELLPDADIHYIERMGYENDVLSGNWHHLADELITSIELKNQQRPAHSGVIGIGHSAGAVVTLMAATKRPDLFAKVILLDPVLFSRRKRLMLGLLRGFGLSNKLDTIKRTLARRSQFADQQQAFDYFSPKTLFKDFHPRCMADYVQYGLKPCDEGFELAISPAHEADIFRSVITRVPKHPHKVKGVMIYGTQSKVLQSSDVNWWQKRLAHFTIEPFEGGHLFPLEQPQRMASVLKKHIEVVL